MDVQTSSLSSQTTGSELRQTTLDHTPSSPTSSAPTPQSPTPLLGTSAADDTEAVSEQSQEKNLFSRLKRTVASFKQDQDITYYTRVEPIIPAGKSQKHQRCGVTDARGKVSDYYPGYGRLAAFEACDPSFLICRKFSWLHNRLLLHIQDELSELERALKREDDRDFRHGDYLMLRARREDAKRPKSIQQSLLKQIQQKLNEYDKLMLQIREVQSLKRPSKRNQGAVYQEMSADNSNIDYVETHWVRRSDDLAALANDAEHGWFNVFLEDILIWFSKGFLLKWFRTREQKIKTGTSSYLNLVSPNRFDAFLKTILTFIAALLLLCPVLILFEIQPADPTQIKSRGRTQFGVVFVFTFAFSACCFLFTKATKQEVFTATAAYSAVLVVFLGNASQALTCANTG